MLGEQRAVYACLDAEHELLALAGRLHRLGRELRRAGHEAHLRRNHVLRRGVQHQAHLGAQRHAAGHGLGQEEGHVHVRQVDQVQHLAARAQHLAGLGHEELHAPVARRHELCVLQLGVDARHRRHGRVHRRGRARCLRLGRRHGGLAGGHLGLGRFQRGLLAAHAGAVVVQFLAGRCALLLQRGRTRQAPLGGIQLGRAGGHLGLGGTHVALAQRDLGACGVHAVFGLGLAGGGLIALRLQAADVHARQWLAGLDEGALVDQDGLHAPGQLGGHIDLGGLDAAIAADEAFARPVVAVAGPVEVAGAGQRQGDGGGHPFLDVRVHGVALAFLEMEVVSASPPSAAYSATRLESRARRVCTRCCAVASRSRSASSTSKKRAAPLS